MKGKSREIRQWTLVAAALLLGFFPLTVQARIEGISGPAFDLTAREGELSTPDGNSIYFWGLADTGLTPSNNGLAQYPAPTLIVNTGDHVTITLHNDLLDPVSLLFPGQDSVAASGGTQGLLTFEAISGGSVTYDFVATHPGTYMYQSGTRPEIQVEMGIVGALIVRPASPMQAYGHQDTKFDHEYLFVLTELDSILHEQMRLGLLVDNTTFQAKYWMINGRAAPDILFPPFVPWLPHQPYNCLPQAHPGERTLLRIVSAGRQMHPYHTHGNNSDIIARDGRMLESVAGAGPDLKESVFTIDSVPGETTDSIFRWTGKKLGWDIYGTEAVTGVAHTCIDTTGDGFDDLTFEWCADHGKPFPVDMPGTLDLFLGGFYSGSPFLGSSEALPPGEGGLNVNGSYFYMWHSHSEKELLNYGIFPGGMMTMMLIEHPSVPIP